MSKHIATIIAHASTFEISLSRGPCPRKRLFMVDRCSYGNLLEVSNPSLSDEEVGKATCVYLLSVGVAVLAARSDYDYVWTWAPKEHQTGRVCFYDTDYDRLLEMAANWLVEHADPIAPDYTYKTYGEATIKSIKCGPIGRIQHYTTTPGFEEGNLERKRDW